MAEQEIGASCANGQHLASKTCSRCKDRLPATTEFFTPIKVRNTLHAWCKSCCAKDRKEKRAADPEHHRKLLRDHYARNAEAYRARNKARWPADSVKYAEATKRRQAEKRDEYNANRRAKMAASAELRAARSEANRIWREANADALVISRREQWARATPTSRLRSNIGAAIYHALKGTGKGGKSWQDLVGYTVDQLRVHLEKQFTKGMTWQNYGEWHVDHILPASSFTYESPEDPDFLACWAMTNLRPLWAVDNMRKRAKRMHLI